MHAVLYRSRARPGLLAGDLNAIIDSASRRNAAMGVTGLLLYGLLQAVPGAPGEFVQWLEGDRESVEAVVERIEADGRHFDVEVLARGPLAEVAAGAPVSAGGRLFPSWSMGLVRLAELPATAAGFLRFAATWDRQTLPLAA